MARLAVLPWLALLAPVLLAPTACRRKEADPPRRDPPVAPRRADPRGPARDAAVPVPAPTRDATPPARPASSNVPPQPLAPSRPAPPRLSAFVAALEATGGKPFAPRPLLAQHVGALDDVEALAGLPAAVTATVLRVGKDPLEAAIVLLTPKGYQICKSHPDPVSFSVFESAPGQKAPLVVSPLEKKLRGDMKPKVELSPAFENTRAFLLHYEIDEEAEGCQQAPERIGRTPDSMAALYKVGQRKLLLYRTFTTSGMEGAWGVTESVETRLTWHASARPGIQYLGIVVSRTKRVVNTGSHLSHESKAGTVHAAVIAMEKGRTWRYLAGRDLKRLLPSEPGLAALPRDESWKHTRP